MSLADPSPVTPCTYASPCGRPTCPTCAQAACTEGFAAGYARQGEAGCALAAPTVAATCPCCLQPLPAGAVVRVTESTTTAAEAISGQRSTNDTRALLTSALEERVREQTGRSWCYAWVRDFTDTEVVYCYDDKTWQCPYSLAESGTVGTVTLGDPVEVVEQTWYVPAAGGDPMMAATEAAQVTVRDRQVGRVIEAKAGTSAQTGGRVFRVRIIATGDSRNGRRYTEAVLTAAASKYDGKPAFDHHRSDDELRTSTTQGLVGYYRDVQASADGLDADLHLLPSATRAAEALDASLAMQEQGLDPLVGISHDVQAVFTPIVDAGRRLQEAVSIDDVNSADIVAKPSAGGKATRVVAGGIEPPTDPAGTVPARERVEEGVVPVKTEDVLAAFQAATPEQLAAYGLTRAGTPTTEADAPPAPVADRMTEAAQSKTGWLAKAMIRQKIEDAGLPVATVEAVAAALPDRVTEGDVDAQIAALKAAMGVAERAGLVPTVTAQVTREAQDKKVEALDAFFAKDWSRGYRSFREAYLDFTGYRPRVLGEDINRQILRESFGVGFDSGARSTESLSAASWAQVLGDSVTRRMVAEYAVPSLQDWRRVVSAIVPVNDFRTQRIGRIGGYGTLPTVNEGQPYQPLTSPGDEEATYAIIKRGGTDDLTVEMIANDDIRAIAGLPALMGRAAAITLYRFVFDFFTTNAATTYDSVALFDAGHVNTTTGALSQSNLSLARSAMRNQARYGDTTDLLSLVPQILVVPNELEEIAFQLTTSAVAIPATAAGPSDTPNLHARMQAPIVVDYWTDANDWFTLADPAMCPTFEIGFYQGRQDPELFTQADQQVGSVFNADKFTYKIRHTYSGTVLDHRGMYRSTN